MRLQALLSVMVGDKLARNSSQSDETELIFLPTGQENLKGQSVYVNAVHFTCSLFCRHQYQFPV